MPKVSLAELERRTRRKVATVPTSEEGRAACIDHPDLFERVELRRTRDYGDRIIAADICNGCPLADRCAFRVIPSGQRRRRTGGAR